MIKSMIGPVTAYADAVKAGYTGTREEFASQQANFAQNAASVESSKLEVKQTVAEFLQTTETAKQDITAEGDRQLQRIADAAPALELDREQIASNTAAIEDVLDIAMDARTIAKGRATGYVFDTVEDMQAWLTVEENTQNLVLGDNLYIRATNVPDYWWDGVQAQKLETQKVDLSEYVKNTDYASTSKAGVVQIGQHPTMSGVDVKNGIIGIAVPTNAHISAKSNHIKSPIIPGLIDLTSVQSAHQEMSNDYDPATALTPDGNVPYAYGGRQPVSYAAVKKYIDSEQNYWSNRNISNPDFEVTLEEDAAYMYIDTIDGKPFEWEECMILADISSYVTGTSASGSVFSVQSSEGAENDRCLKTNAYMPTANGIYYMFLRKILGVYGLEFSTAKYSNWSNGQTTINKTFNNFFGANIDFGDTIKSLCINFNTSVGLPAGMHIRIYGKPAQKGAAT